MTDDRRTRGKKRITGRCSSKQRLCIAANTKTNKREHLEICTSVQCMNYSKLPLRVYSVYYTLHEQISRKKVTPTTTTTKETERDFPFSSSAAATIDVVSMHRELCLQGLRTPFYYRYRLGSIETRKRQRESERERRKQIHAAAAVSHRWRLVELVVTIFPGHTS